MADKAMVISKALSIESMSKMCKAGLSSEEEMVRDAVRKRL